MLHGAAKSIKTHVFLAVLRVSKISKMIKVSFGGRFRGKKKVNRKEKKEEWWENWLGLTCLAGILRVYHRDCQELDCRPRPGKHIATRARTFHNFLRTVNSLLRTFQDWKQLSTHCKVCRSFDGSIIFSLRLIQNNTYPSTDYHRPKKKKKFSPEWRLKLMTHSPAKDVKPTYCMVPLMPLSLISTRLPFFSSFSDIF